jgi:alpha-L-rhamnosidase
MEERMAEIGAPTRLMVEHLETPLGITARRPRLSWWLPEGVRRQVAYRVRAGGWDSGRVDSPESVLVPYGGPEPGSGQRVEWRVKVWTEAGESGWSAPSWWETGLLDPGDWQARWVAPAEREVPPPGRRPAHLLRRAFTLPDGIGRARAYATAHGVYELVLNGSRVGDMELTPGFTSYHHTLQVQTYDVTGLLTPGENVIGAVLSDGWFRGETGYHRQANGYGSRLALLVQLRVELEGGGTVVLGTGPEWRCATGAIVAADLIEGQEVDFGHARCGWVAPGSPEGGWEPVELAAPDPPRLASSPAPPVRRVEELRPVRVTALGAGRHVVDMGQNINGWLRVANLGPAGTRLTLTHGEALDADGDVTMDHLRPRNHDTGEFLSAGQVDRVTSAGRPEDVFEPRHTTHGFQFVRVEGCQGSLTQDDVTGVVVHTDLRRTGWFRCSDERVNRLHEAAVWSFRGNACDVPTDCPQRERAGWTGDWQLFVPTAAFLYDVAGFSLKWLRDLAADQWRDGRVTNVVPDPGRTAERDDDFLTSLTGSAGWGDAAVIVPWEIWRNYGDRQVLEDQWASMVAWVEFAARTARERRHPDRAAGRPQPAPHEAFLWDSGFHWGEWLAPGESSPDFTTFRTLDKGDVATAFLCRSASLLARIARLLEREEDAARYAQLADAVRAAWQAEYIGPDGRITPSTQANHVRALAFGLVPDQLRATTIANLVALIREAGTHLGTGFLATPDLLPVLADSGHLDLAYELLFQDTPPSWLTMIDRGATTIWEQWDGIDAGGVPHASLNHYSKGAVISFLHTRVAGIQLPGDGPGYRRFAIRPRPGGGINWAEAVHDSPYGRIESSWRVEGGRFQLHAVVPSGTIARVELPDGRFMDVGPGPASFECEI